MIKANVITRNISWFKYIKNPDIYIGRKINKLNAKNKKLKDKDIFFTLLLSGEKEIKNLNRKFRKKNKSTDVLSFPSYEKKKLSYKIKREKEVYLGDIIINLNQIKKNDNKIKFKEEFNKLWIHGLLHLLGYDHKSNMKYLQMQKLEKNLLYLIR